MHVQVIRYSTRMPPERVLALYAERAGNYRSAPGLTSKYYLHDPESGAFGGVYLWESKAAMETFWTAERLADFKAAYAIEGEPRIEDYEVPQAIDRT